LWSVGLFPEPAESRNALRCAVGARLEKAEGTFALSSGLVEG